MKCIFLPTNFETAFSKVRKELLSFQRAPMQNQKFKEKSHYTENNFGKLTPKASFDLENALSGDF